ncbi:hypothetical protein GCM10023319_06140 [Nocardia iowensis]
MLSHSTAVAMPSGPTEPVTRSQDQFPRGPVSLVSPGAGVDPIPAVLLSVTIVQYPVCRTGYLVALS